MDWVSTQVINNQDRFWIWFCRRRRRCWVNIFTTKSLGLFSTLMSDNWSALTSVGLITFDRLTLWSSFSSCLCPSWSNFRWSAMLLYANFDGLWWACLLPKLLLYLGMDKIGLIGLELNREGNNFSFICCAKQRTILLGVLRAWWVLHDHRLSDLEWSFVSMITTCDRSANIHVACST